MKIREERGVTEFDICKVVARLGILGILGLLGIMVILGIVVKAVILVLLVTSTVSHFR